MERKSIIASYCSIPSIPHHLQVQVICNHLFANVDYSPKKSLKYKKVGKASKALLL